MIAFTATPTPKTLQTFGTLNTEGNKVAFDLYSMKQAIDEGFILNVLENYITYNTYFKLNKTINAPTAWHLVSIQCSRTVHYTLN